MHIVTDFAKQGKSGVDGPRDLIACMFLSVADAAVSIVLREGGTAAKMHLRKLGAGQMATLISEHEFLFYVLFGL